MLELVLLSLVYVTAIRVVGERNFHSLEIFWVMTQEH